MIPAMFITACRPAAVAIASCAVALAACSKPEADLPKTDKPAVTAAAPSAPKGAVDVCALVQKDAVASVIQQPIVKVLPGPGRCKYETDDAMASSVEIVVSREGAAQQMETVRKAAGALTGIGSAMENGKGATGDVGKMVQGSADAPGIGEQALFDSSRTLHVVSKGAYIAVTPPVMKSRSGPGNPVLTADERRDMAKAIAQKVIAAL